MVIARCRGTHSALGNISASIASNIRLALNKMSAPVSATAPTTARNANSPKHQVRAFFGGCLPMRLKSARVSRVQATPEFKTQLQQHIKSLNDKAKQVTTISPPTYLSKYFSISLNRKGHPWKSHHLVDRSRLHPTTLSMPNPAV